MSACKACGQKLIWIKMQTGGMMPCNPDLESFIVIEQVKKEGHVFKGYVPHWATCPDAKRFKKG